MKLTPELTIYAIITSYMPEFSPNALERYFAKHADTQYPLCSSDCEPFTQTEVLAMADQEMEQVWANLSLAYTSYTGHPLLRQEISQLYRDIDPNEILVVTPVEGIKIAAEALVRPGDHIICPFPAFQSLYQVALDCSARISYWMPNEDEGWRYDERDLKALIRDNTRLVVLNFPHCPTGYLPEKAEFLSMIKTADRVGAYVFSDEIYKYSEQDESRELPSACDLYDRAISLHGMSKVFGMPGVRIGWLATRDEYAQNMINERKDYTSTCAPASSEILAAIGLRAKDAVLTRSRDILKTNLPLLRDFLDRHKSLFSYTTVPQAGTMWFVQLKLPISSYDFTEQVAEKTSIMLLPSTVVGYSDRYIRFGFGRANMPEVLERLEGCLTTFQ